ncbi:Fcf2 pre-rRNA processing C-terminal domain-containing protein [Abortiporus biennis]
MSVSSIIDKGKGRALPSSPNSDSDSDDSSDDSSSSDEEEVTQEYLNSLLHKARQNAIASSSSKQLKGTNDDLGEEEVIAISGGSKTKESPLPSLDPGSLPPSYIDLPNSKHAGPSKIRDLDAERIETISASKKIPDGPPAPPELDKHGQTLTKKQRKEMKNKTAGPAWYDLPAPAEADLPKLYREVEALRLRNQLDPKRFYRRDEGEGKGIKGLPKHFAIGTIIAEKTPFGTASADNLSRSQRKRTLVDELVDDAEAKSYAKKKFKELQTVRGAKGRGTLAKKKALRQAKW